MLTTDLPPFGVGSGFRVARWGPSLGRSWSDLRARGDHWEASRRQVWGWGTGNALRARLGQAVEVGLSAGCEVLLLPSLAIPVRQAGSIERAAGLFRKFPLTVAGTLHRAGQVFDTRATVWRHGKRWDSFRIGDVALYEFGDTVALVAISTSIGAVKHALYDEDIRALKPRQVVVLDAAHGGYGGRAAKWVFGGTARKVHETHKVPVAMSVATWRYAPSRSAWDWCWSHGMKRTWARVDLDHGDVVDVIEFGA
jgi:hypothetical protein